MPCRHAQFSTRFILVSANIHALMRHRGVHMRGSLRPIAGDDHSEGCIFTNKLIVDDAAAAEITRAVAGASARSSALNSTVATTAAHGASDSTAKASACAVVVTATVSAAPAANASATKSVAASASAGSASSAFGSTANVQSFTGSLGGAAPAVIQSSGDRAFSVNGSTFVNSGAALQRPCAIQDKRLLERCQWRCPFRLIGL
ncbi:hypothetical protein LZ554_003402 [Drepanopeziza brunnea f. sp. 'monogermtubi']|nr:hypothetical protein LZ554_003402 [Drepanopeziza brunnea f. sp. 'monogermtubi']